MMTPDSITVCGTFVLILLTWHIILFISSAKIVLSSINQFYLHKINHIMDVAKCIMYKIPGVQVSVVLHLFVAQ